MAFPAHEQVMLAQSAPDPQGQKQQAGGRGQQMPNGTTGAASSVTANDVVADGSQRIRSGREDRGGEEDPGHLPQPDVDSLPSKGTAAAFAGLGAQRLDPDDRQAVLANLRAGAGSMAGVEVSAIAVDPAISGALGAPGEVRPQGSMEDTTAEGLSVLPQGLRWMGRLGEYLRPSRVERLQAQLWPSPFPSPERRRVATGQVEAQSPLFSVDAVQRLQAIQDRTSLLYGSPSQPQNPTPSSTSISAEAIQAEVQRQLGPLVEHIQRLERLNELLQQQAQQGHQPQQTAAPELHAVRQPPQTAAPELQAVRQPPQTAAPELHAVRQPLQTLVSELRPTCSVSGVATGPERVAQGTSCGDAGYPRTEGTPVRSEGLWSSLMAGLPRARGNTTTSTEPRANPTTTSTAPLSEGTSSPGLLDALAKGVQQLQEIQAQTLQQQEDKSPEAVRTTIPALPSLKAPSGSLSGLELQDWLDLVGTCVADVSNNSCSWWEQVLEEVHQAYARWLGASPLERVRLVPTSNDDLETGRWTRLNARVCTLLLAAVEDIVKQDLVARQVTKSTMRILYRLFVIYQPGGANERAIVLQRLQGAGPYDTVQKALESIRNWPRWVRRCNAMAMAVPDPTVLAKALADTAEPHLKEPDVMFRVQLVKSTLRIDGQPSFENVQSYQQHLQAELESIVAAKPAGDVVGAVKQLQAGGGLPGRGGVVEEGEKIKGDCRFFLKATGCRRGTKCPFCHDLSSLTKQQRSRKCLSCGSEEHRQKECPTRGGSPSKGREPTAGNQNASLPSSAYRAAEPGSSASLPATSMAALATVPDSASAMSGAERVDHGGYTDGHEKTGKPILTLENMVEVAAQVMQATPSSTGTASLPSMRVLRVKSVSRATVAEGEGKPCALLDSGATHALRKATSEEEWLKGELVKVALAGGQSITMRMNEAQTLLLPPTPDDGEGSKASIVPMGALVATLGYKMEWNQSRCKLIGRNGEEIKLKVRGGCPELSEAQALNLIARLEEDKLKSLNDTVIKSQGRIREAALRLKETWFDRLRRYANTGKMADAAQAIVEAPHHVNIPMQCFEGMAVETGDETLWTLLKELGFWNRRRRKQILQSDRIVLHLFSGKGEKPQFRRLEGNGRIVLPIDLENGQDVCHPALWKVLVKICAKGKVDAVIGGPPCRTFSILRHRPPGPPPLRSRTHPYGLPQLEAANRDYVNQDTAYFVRHLYLHSLATAGRVERGDVRTKEVAMALEQPADPDEYLNPETELWGKVPTFWRTPLWEIYHQENMMEKITFDQHVLGHVARKPTTVGTNMWSLKQLDGMQAEGNPPPWKGSSSELATWAPGLCEAIAEGLRDWGDAPRLLRMTPEQWRDHVNRGHLPYRRDCVTCVMGGGVGRRHGRVEHPEAFTLTADTSGPVKTPGEDCHARGSKRKIKYLLVARLRVPKFFLQGAGCPADDSLEEEDMPEGIPEDPMEAVVEEEEIPPRDIEEEDEEAERDPEERREGHDREMKD